MHRVSLPDITLAYRDEGRRDAPAVLLLHGFPDSSALWEGQIAALTGAGLRAIAPDLRGFGESDRPEAVDAYKITHGVADVAGLLDHLGLERVHVVGHDWGAGLAWALAGFLPARVERLVALSVGCPGAVLRTVEMREKSWYMLLFQFPGLAEKLLPRDDWALLREWLRGDGDLDRILADLSRPGALIAGLNWYRANMSPWRELEPARPFPRIPAPTLGIWSDGDHYLLEEAMRGSGAQVDGPWRYERVEGASHWLQLDQPERVNELLLEFLTHDA